MRTLSCCAVVVICMATPVLGAPRVIEVLYRDFTGVGTTAELSNPPSTHPDFENEDAHCWNVVNQAPSIIGGRDIGVIADEGIVELTLGPDGKPVYASTASGNTTTGADNFSTWYNDDPTYNLSIPDQLVLADQGDGTFVFDSDDLPDGFFPIDNRGFGNTVREKNNLPDCSPPLLIGVNTPVSTAAHNWHFTMEMHTQFTFQGDEQFTFEGDDDLWVFIDGQLVIDLGGTHNRLSRTIDLTNLETVGGSPISLEVGQNYDFDLFYAERHRNDANFRVETSLLLGVPEPASVALLAVSGMVMRPRRRR